MENKAQIIYFSHGGGPMPIIGEPSHQRMVEFMQKLPEIIRKPKAIIVISAHWEERVPTLLGGKSPSMYYDYYGFPAETYSVQYPAPGDPELAERTSGLLQSAGLSPYIDTERGFDHGLFIPMLMMYPDADIPSIQLSLIKGLDAERHLALGRALKPLLEEDVLIIGSGFSFHNMGAFTFSVEDEIDERNDSFQNWLIDVCTGGYSAEERESMLAQWHKAPGAQYCHPRQEHLIPLHVCQAMAGNTAELIFHDYIAGKRAVAFLWR